jgi:hypothetical protein
MMPSGGMHGPYKKDMHFPMDTVESTQPHLSKRRKLTKHDVGKFPHYLISCCVMFTSCFYDNGKYYRHQVLY